jgi:hypothetical protein
LWTDLYSQNNSQNAEQKIKNNILRIIMKKNIYLEVGL